MAAAVPRAGTSVMAPLSSLTDCAATFSSSLSLEDEPEGFCDALPASEGALAADDEEEAAADEEGGTDEDADSETLPDDEGTAFEVMGSGNVDGFSGDPEGAGAEVVVGEGLLLPLPPPVAGPLPSMGPL